MREIKIEHLARVEGHGAIRVEVDGKKVKKVDLEVLEGPRLFETITLGKLPSENLSIVPRICAICTLSHKNASLRGLEKALGIKVPEKTDLLRSLMLHGEAVESHSLHVGLLALPDLLGYPNAIAMTDKYADTVIKALTMKKFGNKVMETISARATHGENPIIGGFGRFPTNEELFALKDQVEALIPMATAVIDIVGPMKFPTWLDEETQFACMEPGNKEYGLVGEQILISDGTKLDVEDYKNLTNERVVPHSYAKRSRYKEKPYTVGSIARVNLLGPRLTGKAKSYYERYHNDRWKKNPIFNNVAQSIELLYALEKIPPLIDKITGMKDPAVVKPGRDTGKGTGGVEAPRGTLFHSYEIKNGRMSKVDIITPTAQNLEDMERYMAIAAQAMLDKGEKDDAIKKQLEIVARSYDPCVSCSAHLVDIVRK
jgi:sulfhydrogenase subunit alpha